jgi:hypothetical protein
MGVRRTGAIGASLLVLGALVRLGVTYSLPTAGKPSADAILWPSQDRTGTVPIRGQVPLVVARHRASFVRRRPANAVLRLNFGLPLANRGALNTLIDAEAATQQYLTR